LNSDGKWHLVGKDSGGGVRIRPYRCYLLLNGGNRALSLDMELEDNEEEDANGIEEPEIDTVKTIDRDGTEQIFDLTGRRLQRSPEHGFYILNGKKYFKK